MKVPMMVCSLAPSKVSKTLAFLEVANFYFFALGLPLSVRIGGHGISTTGQTAVSAILTIMHWAPTPDLPKWCGYAARRKEIP